MIISDLIDQSVAIKNISFYVGFISQFQKANYASI